MNLINLKRMYNHILLNVPQEKINMKVYRGENDFFNHECGTVGCVLGHCTILDKYENIPFNKNNEILFDEWCKNFTGLGNYSINWDWCFSGFWPDDKEQILLRLKYLINNQSVPYNWIIRDFDYVLPLTELEPYDLFL